MAKDFLAFCRFNLIAESANEKRKNLEMQLNNGLDSVSPQKLVFFG